MSYYDDNENKIRRRKVSSNNSNSKPVSKQNINRNSAERTSSSDNKKIESKRKATTNTSRSSRKQLKKKNKSKKILGFVKKLLVVILVLGFVGSIAGTALVNAALKDSPDMTYSYLKEASVKLKSGEDSEKLKYVKMVDIPSNLSNAVISIEDERFDNHKGVDFISLGRAAVHNIFSKSTQGGSTIEMQLSKNLVTNMDQTMQRKIKDMYNAKQMNKNLNKREILELYLNSIYLGSSGTPVYGVAKGAEVYFGKDIKDLDLGECAMLAGITNNPKLYSTNYEAAKKRRDIILYKMKELKYITKDEYEVAKKKDTPMKVN